MSCEDRGRPGSRVGFTAYLVRLASAVVLAATLVVPVALPVPLLAQDAGAPLSSEEGLFRKSDLIYAALFLGSIAAFYPLQEVDEELTPTRQLAGVPGTFASIGEVVGNGALLYAVGGATFAAGSLLGSSKVARTAIRSLEALLVADVLVTPFKVVVGRRRPTGVDPNSDEFRAFSFAHENNSFPSGHTAHLFAIASTLSRELRSEAPWVPFVAYPVAGLVGASRMVGRKHWLTDVLAGATAGLFAGQLVGRLHSGRSVGLPGTPFLFASGDGVTVGAGVSLP